MAPVHTQKVSGLWGEGCKLFFWDFFLQMVSHSLRQRSAGGTPPTPAAHRGWTLSPLIIYSCFSAISEVGPLTPYEIEKEGRNCICFVPSLCTFVLTTSAGWPLPPTWPCSSIFHIFTLVLCLCSLTLHKVSFPQLPATGYTSATKTSGQMKKGKIRRRGWPRLFLGVPFSTGFSSSSGSLSKPEWEEACSYCSTCCHQGAILQKNTSSRTALSLLMNLT